MGKPTPSGRSATGAAPRQIDHCGASGSGILVFMLAWLALIGWGIWARRLPLWVSGLAMVLNLMTFYMYWLDKYAAQQGRWRTAENTLHLVSVLGGWPGAWFAQQILRHKSRKAAFRATYWASVVTHCAALLGWLLWPQLQTL